MSSFGPWPTSIPTQSSPETVIFFADPDELSALVVLANYGRGDNENVIIPFAAGCQTIGIYPYREATTGRPRAVVGLTDLSARLAVRKQLGDNLLSFAMPFALFTEMEANVEGSFLQRHTWQELLAAKRSGRMSAAGDERGKTLIKDTSCPSCPPPFFCFWCIDPLGNVPFFLCVLKKVDERRRKAIILRELGIAFGVLVLFLFCGRYLLLLLQISEPSLGIAGGIILFIISIRMIFLGAEKVFEDILEGEPFIVPLAIPSVAGPSAMATVLLLMAREPARWPEWLAALAGACFLSGVILFFSSGLIRLLGERVLAATERLMGMILTTVAVEMFLSALRTLYHP